MPMLVYSLRMKSNFAIKFLLVVSSGALLGQLVNLMNLKWHHLGRAAFLSYQANQFDRSMANPKPGFCAVVVCAIFALVLGAIYEGTAYAGAKIISLIMRRKNQASGTRSE